MSEQPLKIAYLTSGAAGMFCGSCMHDNSLAKGMIAAGADVQLIPTYTPIRTDEDSVSVDQVFFGGINIYLQQKIPLFRHLPRFLDRFLDRPKIIRRATAKAVEIDSKLLGDLTVSMLKGLDGYQRKEVKRLADWLKQNIQPDVVVLTNILIGGCIPHLKETLGCPVFVTLQGDDIFLKDLPEPYQKDSISEIRKLVEHVDGFLAHSQYYANMMSKFLSIPIDKIHVTPLAIETGDFESLAAQRQQIEKDEPVTIGYLARLAPEKGFHLLVDAFIDLNRKQDVPKTRLLIAGWLGAHRQEYVDEQFEKLRKAGLEDAYQYLGSVDREGKVKALAEFDLLCVPTVYQEPKGLFALEAFASGLPCVLPRHGAFPEMIEDIGGGELFEPENVADLSRVLADLVKSPQRRYELSAQAREVLQTRRHIQFHAKQTLEILDGAARA